MVQIFEHLQNINSPLLSAFVTKESGWSLKVIKAKDSNSIEGYLTIFMLISAATAE